MYPAPYATNTTRAAVIPRRYAPPPAWPCDDLQEGAVRPQCWGAMLPSCSAKQRAAQGTAGSPPVCIDDDAYLFAK